jgi:hypothetical protein
VASYPATTRKNYSDEGVYNTFHAGVCAEYGFSDKFSIQPERCAAAGVLPAMTPLILGQHQRDL